MQKRILVTVGLVLILIILVVWGHPKYQRYKIVTQLFTGAEQMQHFSQMNRYFPTRSVDVSNMPRALAVGKKTSLPKSFVFQNKAILVTEFLAETDTSALLVMSNGSITHEAYWRSGGQNQQWLSMSLGKSFVSALIGVALDEGLIKSVDDNIADYLPELSDSAYDGVSIKHVLQMSSGASWNEDYSDPNSDVNRLARIFALGGSLAKFTTTLESEFPPGSINRYNSGDTQVLGMLLIRVTGMNLSDYMREKLWQPMGATSQGYWLLDSKGQEIAFAGFNATARDYAKLGELYRLGGHYNGTQIIPSQWIKTSTTPTEPHLMPGNGPFITDFGYGYQWWVPSGQRGEYTAIGVYNQFIYVDPNSGTVIVKLSAFSDYATSSDASAYREGETIAFFREIIEHLK